MVNFDFIKLDFIVSELLLGFWPAKNHKLAKKEPFLRLKNYLYEFFLVGHKLHKPSHLYQSIRKKRRRDRIKALNHFITFSPFQQVNKRLWCWYDNGNHCVVTGLKLEDEVTNGGLCDAHLSYRQVWLKLLYTIFF